MQPSSENARFISVPARREKNMTATDMRDFAAQQDSEERASSRSKIIAAAIVAIGIGSVGAYTYYSNLHNSAAPVQQQFANNEPKAATPPAAAPIATTPPAAQQQAAPEQQPVTAPDTPAS